MGWFSQSLTHLVSYEAGSKLAGVIFIHCISDKRFSETSARNFEMFRQLCGDDSLKNVVLVTNMWGKVIREVGEAREKELTTTFFKHVLEQGAQLARHHNTIESAHDIIRLIMKNSPTPLQIQRELVDEGRDVINTSAGETINKELNEQMKKHQAEMKAVQEEMLQALNDKDEETRKELEGETRKLQAQMDKMKADSDNMASKYLEQKQKTDDAMKELQEKAERERKEAEAAHKAQLELLQQRLQETASNSSSEREEMMRRINELQQQWDNRPQGPCLIM